MLAGGRLDPQGIYGTLARVQDPGCSNSSSLFVLCPPPLGSEKRDVELKNRLPPNIIPNTAVVRELTITGETGMLVLEVHVKIRSGSLVLVPKREI